MVKRVSQLPINPALRELERHSFWPGSLAVLVGIALLVCGARHLTRVETVDGSTAWETQLVKAYSFGGLQYPEKVAPPPPPKLDDPVEAERALRRWARENAKAEPPTWKVRVDTAARTPCPT